MCVWRGVHNGGRDDDNNNNASKMLGVWRLGRHRGGGGDRHERRKSDDRRRRDKHVKATPPENFSKVTRSTAPSLPDQQCTKCPTPQGFPPFGSCLDTLIRPCSDLSLSLSLSPVYSKYREKIRGPKRLRAAFDDNYDRSPAGPVAMSVRLFPPHEYSTWL